jgi:hypothetical protein
VFYLVSCDRPCHGAGSLFLWRTLPLHHVQLQCNFTDRTGLKQTYDLKSNIVTAELGVKESVRFVGVSVESDVQKWQAQIIHSWSHLGYTETVASRARLRLRNAHNNTPCAPLPPTQSKRKGDKARGGDFKLRGQTPSSLDRWTGAETMKSESARQRHEVPGKRRRQTAIQNRRQGIEDKEAVDAFSFA